MPDITVTHPAWIFSGGLVFLIGFWLFRWGNRNNFSGAIQDAAKGAVLGQLKKAGIDPKSTALGAQYDELRNTPGGIGKAGKIARFGVRYALAQVAWIIGVIAMIAGLLMAVLGVYYT